MAGTKGMASPNKIQPIDPTIFTPQGVAIPQSSVQLEPTGEIDYEALANEVAGGQQIASYSQPTDEIDYESLANEVAGATQIEQSVSATVDDFTQEQPSIMNRIGELPARAKASFQVSDKEIKTSLEQSFGKENVRTRNNSTEYKGKDNKWRVWDAGITAEDFTVDLIRPVIEEVPASLATLAASVPAVASMMASGGITAPASVAGVALARSGGALAGQATADFLQSMTGVPRDKDRSAVLEYGLTAVLAPVSGMMSDYATKTIAKNAAKSGTRKLIEPNVLYKEQIESTKQALDEVKKLGGLENLPGTNTPVMLYHLNPSNQTARELTEKASHLKGYDQMEQHLIQNFENSSQSFIKTLGNVNPENMKSGQEFKNYVEETIAKEGALIGDFRKSFKKEAGDVALKIPNMSKKVEDFAVNIGFDKVSSKGSKDFKKQWAEILVNDGYNKQAANIITDKTDKVLTKVINSDGSIKADELLGMYEELNGVYRNLAKRGADADPLFKSKIGELRRIVTDQLNESVGEVTGGDVGKKYMKSLAEFSELSKAGDEFSGLLEKNMVASHSLSKAIFGKGSNALDTAEAAKVLLKDRPDLIDDVKGSFLLDTMSKSVNKYGKTDWIKFNKTILDPELQPVVKSIFGEKAIEGFKSYQTVARAIENGNVGASNSADRALFLKNLSTAGKSVVTASNAGLEAIRQITADNSFAEIITKEGIDNFLKTAPKDSKPFLKKILSGFQNLALRGAQVSDIPFRRLGKQESKENANEVNSLEEQ